MELTERYKIGAVIGEGNFAVVKQCLHRASRKEYALKVINKTKCQGREQMIDNEVSILRRVKHPNIIQLVEDFETPSELYLVMELVKVGNFSPFGLVVDLYFVSRNEAYCVCLKISLYDHLF